MITSNHWLLTIERRISNIHKLMIFPKYAKRDPSFGIVKTIIISLIFTGDASRLIGLEIWTNHSNLFL